MYPIIEKGVQHAPVIDIVDPSKTATMMSEMRLAAEFGETLAKVYPGYYWLVNVDFSGPIATIECGQISTEVQSNMQYKYVLHLKNLLDPSATRRRLLNAAGEILERAFLRRGKWNGAYPTLIHGVKGHHQPNARIIRLSDYQRAA